MKNTIAGVDLAKDVIQVCVCKNNKVHSNTEMPHREFLTWLFKSKSMTLIFEACGTSNYWKQRAIEAGHDALAIVQASQLADIQFIKGKSVEQQQLQSMVRLREFAIKQKTASSNQIKALLLGFNIRVSSKQGGLKGVVESLLEDAENDFSFEFKHALNAAWGLHLEVLDSIRVYDRCLETTIEGHDDCKRLLKLEGVGTLNAINLYIALGCADLGVFNKGKDASACIGLTPLQHSSGGVTKLGHIGKTIKNSPLRSRLITGAMAVVNQVVKRTAVTRKEAWIQGLVARRGKKCAAVALANKTVRRAYVMLTQGTEYKAELVTA